MTSSTHLGSGKATSFAHPVSPKQKYGDDPLAMRETDHYREEYVHEFVDKWDKLIDWESRAKAEGEFFIETLRAHGAKKILDVATGTGFHSVMLRKAGFEVTSADGSPVMLAKAFENGRRHKQLLRVVHADWRWLNRDVHDLYDAVICLGNSFTHLHKERDRRKALAEYYATLRHSGMLILRSAQLRCPARRQGQAVAEILLLRRGRECEPRVCRRHACAFPL